MINLNEVFYVGVVTKFRDKPEYTIEFIIPSVYEDASHPLLAYCTTAHLYSNKVGSEVLILRPYPEINNEYFLYFPITIFESNALTNANAIFDMNNGCINMTSADGSRISINTKNDEGESVRITAPKVNKDSGITYSPSITLYRNGSITINVAGARTGIIMMTNGVIKIIGNVNVSGSMVLNNHEVCTWPYEKT